MNTLYDLYINLKQSQFNIESYLNSLNYNKRGKTYEKVFMIYILSDCYEHYKLLDDNYEIITDKQKYLHNFKIKEFLIITLFCLIYRHHYYIH